MLRTLTQYWKTILFFAATLYLYFFRVPQTVEVDIPSIDKIAHFVLYFILPVIFLWDHSRVKEISAKIYWLCWFWCVLYGGVIELCQHFFFAYRTGSWLDFWMDTAGVIYGIIFFIWYKKSRLYKPASSIS